MKNAERIEFTAFPRLERLRPLSLCPALALARRRCADALGDGNDVRAVVFVHPLRVVKLRAATIAATFAWFVLACDAIYQGLQPQLWAKVGFVAIAVYFLALPLFGIPLGRMTEESGLAFREMTPCRRARKLAIAASPRRADISARPGGGVAREDCKSLHPGSIPGEASMTSIVGTTAGAPWVAT